MNIEYKEFANIVPNKRLLKLPIDQELSDTISNWLFSTGASFTPDNPDFPIAVPISLFDNVAVLGYVDGTELCENAIEEDGVLETIYVDVYNPLHWALIGANYYPDLAHVCQEDFFFTVLDLVVKTEFNKTVEVLTELPDHVKALLPETPGESDSFKPTTLLSVIYQLLASKANRVKISHNDLYWLYTDDDGVLYIAESSYRLGETETQLISYYSCFYKIA